MEKEDSICCILYHQRNATAEMKLHWALLVDRKELNDQHCGVSACDIEHCVDMAGGVRTGKDDPDVVGLKDMAMFWDFRSRAELNNTVESNIGNLSAADHKAFRDSSDPQSQSADEAVEVPAFTSPRDAGTSCSNRDSTCCHREWSLLYRLTMNLTRDPASAV